METTLNHRKFAVEILLNDAEVQRDGLRPSFVKITWLQTKPNDSCSVVSLAGYYRDGFFGGYTLQPDQWPDWICDLINEHSPKWGRL